MRYITLFFTLALFLSAPSSVISQNSRSTWPAKPITIDGKTPEWPEFFRFYLAGARMQYDLYNDSANLYICVRVMDADAQTRIMRSGLTIWIDTTGKKKQKIGIGFPTKMEHAGGDMQQRRIKASDDPSSGPSEKMRVNRLKERVMFAQNMMKAIGMAGITEPMMPLQNKFGIEIAFDWDSLNELCIEYKIPLALVYHHPVNATNIDHPIGLSLTVGAVESSGGGEHHSEGAGNNASRSGGGGRGGGGMGGGGGGGGGRRGGGGSNGAMANNLNPNDSEQKGYIKLDFAKGPEVK